MDSVYFVCVYFVDTPLQDVDGLCLDFCMCLLCGYAAVGCGWTLSRPWSSALSSSSFGEVFFTRFGSSLYTAGFNNFGTLLG
jgi:hypothetical protein